VDKDVAPAVAIEHELRGPAYIIRVAQINYEIARAVQDNHGVVGCQPRGDRAADRTGAAGHDGNTAIPDGFGGHQAALRSLSSSPIRNSA
jgi:hypothetical protein